MPRPRKGDRVELLTRPERLVSEKIKQQAAARGMSVSQYVADLLAMSRQNLRKLMLNHPDSFPPPVHEGSASIWRLADLLAWFAERGHALQPALLEAAGAARQVNLARDAGQLSPEMLQGIKPLIS